MKHLAILGAGSWGTALGIALAGRFARVQLWAHDPTKAIAMASARENAAYLKGFPFPANINVSHELPVLLCDADAVICVVPSQNLEAVVQQAAPYIKPGTPVISATKGLQHGTLRRMSQIVADTVAKPARVAVLSGPTFAREVALGEPAAIVIAANDLPLAEEIQKALATSTLRFYTSTDVIGVEIGAALKNVIAIGAGICNGLGLGTNSVAALVTRGLAEITRLAVALGGSPRTLAGLAGLGDLVLTATGALSRNRAVGVQLGQGRKLAEILEEMNMVAEGVYTCRAACELGAQNRVSLPIIEKMREVLYEDKPPRHAIRELMERPLTYE